MARRWHRIVTAFAVGSAALIMGVLTSGSAPAAAAPVTPTPVPLLSITMTDGVTAPRLGAHPAYAIDLVNRDPGAITMAVRLALPAGLTGVVPAAGGTLTGRELSFPVSLPAGARVSLRFTGTATVAGRLAVTACAYLGGGARPTVCASDLDRVTAPSGGGHRLPAILGGAVIFGLLGIGAYRVSRRFGARPEGVAAARSPAGITVTYRVASAGRTPPPDEVDASSAPASGTPKR